MSEKYQLNIMLKKSKLQLGTDQTMFTNFMSSHPTAPWLFEIHVSATEQKLHAYDIVTS